MPFKDVWNGEEDAFLSLSEDMDPFFIWIYTQVYTVLLADLLLSDQRVSSFIITKEMGAEKTDCNLESCYRVPLQSGGCFRMKLLVFSTGLLLIFGS